VRHGVEALRAGWPTDPCISETLPLQSLLALARRHPRRRLQLMNLSPAEAVEQLRDLAPPQRPEATVCWWHLLADSGGLNPIDEGWRVVPPLGTPSDRRALQQALADAVIEAVAVHHVALDPEEQLLPLDQRAPGVAGHRFVLPCLWQELVVAQGWTAGQLWRALCFGPARLLGLEAPRLQIGEQRWLLFDPQRRWRATRSVYVRCPRPGPSCAQERCIPGHAISQFIKTWPREGATLAPGQVFIPGRFLEAPGCANDPRG
jgi:dihydroorotase